MGKKINSQKSKSAHAILSGAERVFASVIDLILNGWEGIRPVNIIKRKLG